MGFEAPKDEIIIGKWKTLLVKHAHKIVYYFRNTL